MFDRKAYMKEYHKRNYKNNKNKIDSTNKEYYLQHRNEIIEYKKGWYIENREERLRKQKENYDPKVVRKYHLKTNYNITVEEYNNMFDFQEGKCAICKLPQSKSLHVDHNHATGKIRGLLCQKCNHGIGQFNDNPDLLSQARIYLLDNI